MGQRRGDGVIVAEDGGQRRHAVPHGVVAVLQREAGVVGGLVFAVHGFDWLVKVEEFFIKEHLARRFHVGYQHCLVNAVVHRDVGLWLENGVAGELGGRKLYEQQVRLGHLNLEIIGVVLRDNGLKRYEFVAFHGVYHHFGALCFSRELSRNFGYLCHQSLRGHRSDECEYYKCVFHRCVFDKMLIIIDMTKTAEPSGA